MSQENDPYTIAMDIRNFEIKLFWQRSNYFLVLNTAIASGVFLIDIQGYKFMLSIFGFIVSLLWISINLGGKYWQDRWEAKLFNIEGAMKQKIELFNVTEEVRNGEVKQSLNYDEEKWYKLWRHLINILVMIKPSVSRTMILLSIVFMFFWFILVILNIRNIDFSPLWGQSNELPMAPRSLLPFIKMTPAIKSVLLGFFPVFFGIILSFWYERRSSKKRKKSVVITLLQFIKTEVEKNIILLNQIVDEAKKGTQPLYTLSTANLDAGWSTLVEYPISDRSLLDQISRSFFEYKFINRTLDLLWMGPGAALNTFTQNTLPLCVAEIKRSKKLLEALEKHLA